VGDESQRRKARAMVKEELLGREKRLTAEFAKLGFPISRKGP